MSGTSTKHGEIGPAVASHRRSGFGATALLLGAALLTTATVSDEALAQPTGSETATPSASGGGASATPTTGAAIDQATDAQKTAATKPYESGVAAMDGQKYDEALTKFRESYGIVASPNTRLMVVRALAEGGHHVQAYREALITVKECDLAATKDPKYEKAAVGAREELAALKPKVALVTVQVGQTPSGSTLTVAGEEIAPSVWGQELAVAPGDIEVALTTPDGTETAKITVDAGDTKTMDIAAPEAKADQGDEPKTEAVASEEGGFELPDRRMMAYIAGGVGALGLVNLGIFGMLSNARMTRLENQCDDDSNCAESLEGNASSGKTYTTLANVGLIVGIVGISAGAGLFVWDLMDPDEEQASVIVKPRVGLGPGSLTITGSF